MSNETRTLTARINAAIGRVKSWQAPMRVPVDPTDLDIVLADCVEAIAARDAEIATLRALAWATAATLEREREGWRPLPEESVDDGCRVEHPHDGNPDACPIYYEGCHCSVGALRHNLARAEAAEAAVRDLRTQLATARADSAAMRAALDEVQAATILSCDSASVLDRIIDTTARALATPSPGAPLLTALRTLRTDYLWLLKHATSAKLWLPDHACRTCMDERGFPSDILIDGFACVRHRAAELIVATAWLDDSPPQDAGAEAGATGRPTEWSGGPGVGVQDVPRRPAY